jgi:hypothetical protein
MDPDGFTNPRPPVDWVEYSPYEEPHINSIAQQAGALIPQGKMAASRVEP